MLRRIARSVLLAVIPLAASGAGCYLGALTSGVSPGAGDPQRTPWRSLGAPPEMPVKIVAADVDTLAAETAAGALYHWRWDAGWQKVDDVPPMAHSEPSFGLPHPPPPGEVVDSVQAVARGESGTYAEYALLADGSVWVWKYTQPGLGLLVAFVYGLGGAALGLALGLGVSFWLWRRLSRPRSASRAGQSRP